MMGHEIAHALAKHTAERMSTAMAAANRAAGRRGPARHQQREQPGGAAGCGSSDHGGVQLPNSRTQESEADRIGIELAAKAGYDPHAAVTLWQKMTQATGGTGKSDFLSTHPASEKRRKRWRSSSRR